MRYISTRDNAIQYTASQAIAQGLAKDGGLLTPFYIPKLPGKALDMEGYLRIGYCNSPDITREGLAVFDRWLRQQ